MLSKHRLAARLVALALMTGAGLPVSALAQASFVQNFDAVGEVQSGAHGPSALIAQGWQFRNQSSPVGYGYWYGASGYSQAGAACLTVNSVATWQNSGSMGSSWMILQPVAGQQAGDQIAFWLQDGSMVAGLYGVMEVRYSPSGGTSTGSGPTGTGDFSQVLLSIPNVNERGWTRFSAPVPGPGRLAFRFVIPSTPNSYMFAANFSIDTLTVGVPPPPPYPIPQPGQTVHWTTANSPVQIAYDTTIPAGGTVVVDAGVQVQLAPTMKLHMNGTFDAREGTTFTVPTDAQFNINGSATFTGTAASPVHLGGGAAWFGGDNGYQVKPTGRMTMSHVDLDALVHGATYIYLTGGSVVNGSFVRVTQPECGFYIDRGTLALRDSSIGAGTVHLNESYVLIDRTTFSGAQLVSERYKAGQPVYLNNLTATGVSGDAPFLLTGFDHFFGAQNSISGNLYPVHLAGGGIAPGSTLPLTGNSVNMVHGGQGEVNGRVTFPNLGLDYRIDFPGDNNTELGGRLVIEPGATVRFAPGAYLWATFSSQIDARGLPERPITFARLDPAQAWQTIDFTVNGNRPVLNHCIFDGGLRGVVADETVVRLRECDLTNNDVASRSVNYLLTEIRKCRFTGNRVGIQDAANAAFDAHGGAMPSLIQGNAMGAESEDIYSLQDATGNYWGSASGPTATSNPGGTGDRADPYVNVVPFRQTPPDFTDAAPIVRLLPPSFHEEPGARILLTWTAGDDHAIVSQRIEWVGHSECAPLQVIASNVPGSARSWEITVPAYELSSCIDPAVLRVVAVDAAGQEGFDEAMYNVRRESDGSAPTPAPLAGPYRPGEMVGICTNSTGGIFDACLFLDSENWAVSLGGTTTDCLSGGMTIPAVSTDLARVGIRSGTAWKFSPYFSIRPDASLGDAPPAISMTSPLNNQSFAAGATVPIAWTASDDEGLRSFDVHASYDNGTTWHVIARDLPSAARAYSWQLPPSAGIPDVRVRVLARDLRFQVSSSGADRHLAITAGTGQSCYANCDNSTTAPVLNVQDFSCFLARYAAGDPYANCDGSTSAPVLNVQDFTCFLQRFATGCR